MELVDELVLTPFKEIVDKGKRALENAEDGEPEMLKASKALIREGERALKKIEPLCKKHFLEYGSNFLDALKENDEIAQYRSDLNDLLWEFDDYIEVDDFDPDKFAELQGHSRKAAPRIYDIIMRMKLEPIPKEERPAVTLQSPVERDAASSSSASPTKEHSSRPVSMRSVKRSNSASPAPTIPLPLPPPRKALPPSPGELAMAEPPNQSATPPVPPLPPSINPWDPKLKPTANHIALAMRSGSVERRRPPRTSSAEMSSPTLSHGEPRPSQRNSIPHSIAHSIDSMSSSQSESPTLGTALPAVPINNARPRVMGYPPGSLRRIDQSIPENAPIHESAPVQGQQYAERHSGTHFMQGQYNSAPNMSNQYSSGSNISNQYSSDSLRSSVPATASSVTHSDHNRSSVMSSGHDSSSGVGSPVFSQASAVPLTPASPTCRNSSSGLQVVPGLTNPESQQGEPGDGLIPVDADAAHKAFDAASIPRMDTSITLSDSFYLQKGFCEGAKDVVRGELGVKKVKKPSFSGSQLTAKCTHCFYELDWNEVELDINQSSEANFSIGDVGFRIRFLQKSHLATRRADEPLYGCLFCVHEGKTPHEGDATVFFSQKELCEHLTRHPRPLPHLPGITVVYEPKMPPGMRTSYDLHLRAPPAPSLLEGRALEISKLPHMIAKETVKKMYGMRLLHDRTPAFELATGAKIVGVQFPDKYLGEWCMGYHDGRYASFPFDVARLEAPPPHELRMGGASSNVRAVARWKFVVKDKGKAEWLKFDKGEVISNINWSDWDHWCWSGTNAKGKWGIFPKSHIDIATLRDADDSDRSSTMSGGAATIKSRSGGVLSRLTSRKSEARDRPTTPLPVNTKMPQPLSPTGGMDTEKQQPSFMAASMTMASMKS